MAKRTISSYLYEGFVIVASILIAFALDARWAEHQDRQIEQRLIGRRDGLRRVSDLKLFRSGVDERLHLLPIEIGRQPQRDLREAEDQQETQ